MIIVLRQMQRDHQIGDHPLSRSAAKLLLDDQVLAGQLELAIEDMVRVILDGPGPVLALDGLLQQEASLLRFHTLGRAKQAVEVLIEAMSANPDDPESAAFLVTQLGASKEATRAWWNAIGATEPAHWWQTAAALHTLDNLRPRQEEDLASTVESLPKDTSVLEILVRSHSDALTDTLVARCIDELKRGHADLTGQAKTSSPYYRLAVASDAGHFYDHARKADELAVGRSQGRAQETIALQASRSDASNARLKSASGLWNAHVGSLESAHSSIRNWNTAEAWHQLFDSVEQVWSGDCWPIREALLALPGFAHPVPTRSAAIKLGTSWRNLARWQADARDHRGDVRWWRSQSRRCVDPSATVTYLVTALIIGSSAVVQELTDELNSLVKKLERSDWVKASATIFRYSQYNRGRDELNISQALRIRQINPNS
jgi:hypothetical protein